MITIFLDFCQFLAKNWSFSQNPIFWSNCLQKEAAVLAKKRQYFHQILLRKYF
jgi:hypothetical protein